MLTSYLNGELDIATTAIDSISDVAVGVNLDAAESLGLEIDDELLEQAHVVLEGNSLSMSAELVLEYMQQLGTDETMTQMALALMEGSNPQDLSAVLKNLPPQLVEFLVAGRKSDEFIAADRDYLAGLRCTEEMIAEQQAELDAASE